MIVGLSWVEEEDDGDVDNGDVDDDDGGEVDENDDDVSSRSTVSIDSISQLEITTNDVHQLIFLFFLQYTV